MSFTGIVALLAGVAKSIPALASLCQRLIDLCEQWNKRRSETEALARLHTKDAAVDAAIDGVRDNTSATGQQPATDEAPGLSGGKNSGT